MILFASKGLVFKKEGIVSERLLEIQSIHYLDKEMNNDIVTIETPKKRICITGSQDVIKEIWSKLQEYLMLSKAEARELARLYMERLFLAQNEAFAWTLVRRIKESASKCCICGDEDVSIWILEFLQDSSGEMGFVIGRLFCKEHEKRWREGEILNYKIINGTLVLDKRLNPMDMLINKTWKEVTDKLVSSSARYEE